MACRCVFPPRTRRLGSNDHKVANTSNTHQNSSFTFHDRTTKLASDMKRKGCRTLASASLTPCTGTQRAQRWQRPSSMLVRSCLPGRGRGVVRKAVGGENGRAVDAAIPVDMRASARRARTKHNVTYHENIAYDSCYVHAKERRLERICERRQDTLRDVRKWRELGQGTKSAYHLYAENFVLSQTFPAPVQAQRGQRPTFV